MIRRPPRSTQSRSSAASDVYKRQGYYEAHINAWDVAAGIVLVTEAGGWCNDFFGRPDAMAKGNFILAATPALAPHLRTLLGY